MGMEASKPNSGGCSSVAKLRRQKLLGFSQINRSRGGLPSARTSARRRRPHRQVTFRSCWRQKAGGEDFHDRFLLTDRGGIVVGAGFEAAGNHETTNMLLMSYQLSQRRLAEFTRANACYDLVAPIIKARSDGTVVRVP